MTDWWHKARPSTPDPVSLDDIPGLVPGTCYLHKQYDCPLCRPKVIGTADTPDPRPVSPPSELTGPWTPSFDIRDEQIMGAGWPIVFVVKYEENARGDRRYVDTRSYNFDAARAAELTAEQERMLREVAANEWHDTTFVKSITYGLLRRLLATLDAARAAPQAAQCPACGGSGHEWWTVGDDSYGCAAPQTDANLEGYWERAYWEIVPKLQAALDAAPQADAETLGSSIATAVRRVSNREEFNHLHIDWTALGAALVEEWPALAASPATAGREE